MKTINIDELKSWRTTWTRTHIPVNPLHATVLIEIKEYGESAYIVVEFTSSQSWQRMSSNSQVALRIAGLANGRTEDEAILVPLGKYTTDLSKHDQAEALFKKLAAVQ
jgi:hypothetical protein